MSEAELLLELIGQGVDRHGRPNHIQMCDGSSRPDATGDRKYDTVFRHATLRDCEAHLAGTKTIGGYLTHGEHRELARAICVDADSAESFARIRAAIAPLVASGARPLLEMAALPEDWEHAGGGKLWLVFDARVPWRDARATLYRHAAGLRGLESFPPARVRLPGGLYRRGVNVWCELSAPGSRDDTWYTGALAVQTIAENLTTAAWITESESAPTEVPMEGSIEHPGRNRALTSLGGTMRRRGMSEAAILAALRQENQVRCRPALDDDEVTRIAHSVARYPPEPAGRADATPSPVVAAALSSAGGLPRSPADGPTFRSIGELLEQPEEVQEYLVEGLMPTSGNSLLVAKPKVGKTRTAQNLALAVARGEPFLGRETRPGVVLYCALEEKISEVARHFRLMGAGEGDPLYVYAGAAPDEAMAWLTEEAAARRPALIIIDTLQRFLRLLDLNDYARVVTAMEPLATLARTTGAHLLMTHHGNKRGGEDGDGVLGSVGLFGSVDTLLEMRRTGERRTIRTRQRYGTDLEESMVAIEPGTYRVRLAGTLEEASEKAAEQEILAYLALRPGEALDEPTILEHVEARTGTKRNALRRLLEDGKVQREGEGRRGSPYRYSRFPVPPIRGERENELPL